MALIDLQFGEEAESETPERPAGGIELEFEGQGDREPLAPGVSGYAEPVERDIFEKIGDWFQQGYSEARKNIAQQKGLMLDETAEDKARTGARVKELERQSERYGLELDTMEQLRQISEADSLTDAVGLMMRYPEAVAAVTVSSLGRFAPTLAATAGVGAGTGGAALPLMGTTFVGSLATEYGAVMDEEIRSSGYNSEDPRAWQKAVSDEAMLERARERGLKRGIPIAAFDAISMGLAGKLLAGAKPTATSILSRGVGEVGMQAGLGGMGEAAAQFVETGEVGAPGEVALEAAAEIAPGMVETLIGYRGEKAQALRRQMAEQAGYEAAQREADKTLTPDFEVHSLEENETAIDEALAAAPPTPEVRPDEDSITEKFDLEEEPELDITDPEQLQAEQEANAFVLEQLRAQFPEASEEELLAAIESETQRQRAAGLPTEEDLGWVAPEEAEPGATPGEVRAKPTQPKTALPDEQPTAEFGEQPTEVPVEDVAWGPVTRDEVVQATEKVEPTGEAISTAEAWRSARPEFEGTIFSFKPGDERHGEPMEHYYGEIANTEDADGMPVDVMLNAEHDPAGDTPIFIIDQIDPDTQEFKQHKVMAGFEGQMEAETAFINQWGEDNWGLTSQLTPEEFQKWIDSGDHKRPFRYRPEETAPDTTTVVEPETAVEPTQVDAAQERRDQAEADRRRRGQERARQARQIDETDDLATFVRKHGGLNVEAQSDIPAGRLKHLDEEKRVVGLPGIEQRGDAGRTLAELTELAFEAGYITDNDTQQMIEALFESEQKPVYTPRGYEAAAEREAEEEYQRQVEQDADDMAAYIIEQSGGPRFSSPDIPDLISLAADVDYGAVLDVTGDTTLSEDEVRTRLQAIIDGEESERAETAAAAAGEGEAEVPGGVEGVPGRAPETDAAEQRFPRREAIRFKPITDLTELSRYADNDFSAIDPFLMQNALDMINGAIKQMAEAGYTFEEVLPQPEMRLPDYLRQPMQDVTQAGSALIPLARTLGKIEAGKKGRAKIQNVLDQLFTYTQRLKSDPFPNGKGFKEHVQQHYPKLAARLDEQYAESEEAAPGIVTLGRPLTDEEYEARYGRGIGRQPLTEVNAEPEVTVEFKHKGVEAEVRVAETVDGQWVASISVGFRSGNYSGRSSNPSDWDMPFATKAEAEINALERIQEFGDSAVGDARTDQGGLVSKSQITANNALQKWAEKEIAARRDEQIDFVGKTDEQKAQQAIEDEKRRKAEQLPEERPAEAQAPDDLFAAGGQLPPDLFGQVPEAEPEIAAGYPPIAKLERMEKDAYGQETTNPSGKDAKYKKTTFKAYDLTDAQKKELHPRMQFKTGDEVRFTGNYTIDLADEKGTVGTVVEVLTQETHPNKINPYFMEERREAGGARPDEDEAYHYYVEIPGREETELAWSDKDLELVEAAPTEEETEADESWRLADHATIEDYPIGTEYWVDGYKAKVTGVRTAEETGNRPEVVLEYLEGPRKGEETTQPGHLKTLQPELGVYDIETTRGTVRVEARWMTEPERYMEIFGGATGGTLALELHGPDIIQVGYWQYGKEHFHDQIRFRSHIVPVEAETVAQMSDPAWIEETVNRLVAGLLSQGEYFKGERVRIVGRPFDTMEEVLEASREPTADSTPLNKFKLTYEIGDKKVTHNAKWWVDAIDKRLQKLAKLRTCA